MFAYPPVRSIVAARGKLPREEADITGSEWAGWRNEPEYESTALEREGKATAKKVASRLSVRTS